MVEGTAQERMKRAEDSRTRPALKRMDLQTGELVDIYRTPANKDLTGWRGPATVVDVHAEAGQATVRWQGRTMICKTQDLRRHLFLALLTTSVRSGSKAVSIIRSAMKRLQRNDNRELAIHGIWMGTGESRYGQSKSLYGSA